MQTLIVATTNQHKVHEIISLLDPRQIKLKSLADFENYPDVIEDGKTFAANARKKAVGNYGYFHQPVIADDSGLAVPILNNEPGVFSARYSGPQATDHSNNQLLLKRMQSFTGEERKARFICAVCYKDKYQEKIFTGITEGYILDHFQGTGGFGYDPIFYLPDRRKTYAQLSMAEKNSLSHRGKALEQLISFLIKNKNY